MSGAWTRAREAHESAVDELLAPHRARRSRGERHPVHDFLFTYYRARPGRLRLWHPGVGVVVDGPEADLLLQRRGYTASGDGATVSAEAVVGRAGTLAFVRDLLTATATRPARLSCFGLHEWAMVHGSGKPGTGPGGVRHDVPLRLGADGTDAVVESLALRCTHHDAFRFFTPSGAARNETAPTREDQVATEQPGCVHATMDLYKWCYTLEPLVPSTLLLDCLRLAVDARELDMRASPYDLSRHGYPPVRIETASGRAEYAGAQAELSLRAAPLRIRLLEVCDRAGTHTPAPAAARATVDPVSRVEG